MFTEIKNKKIEHTQLGHMIVQVHDHFDNKNHLHHKAGLRIQTCHERMRLLSYLIHTIIKVSQWLEICQIYKWSCMCTVI